MSKITTKNLNKFPLFKLPSAYISGVRVSSLSDTNAVARVTHRWINQNPFRSLYWATQGMAAELVTGILMIKKIQEADAKISMLVVKQEGSFHKKATGKIIFSCDQGAKIDEILKKAIETNEGQSIVLEAAGYNEDNELVSNWAFTWGVKVKQS